MDELWNIVGEFIKKRKEKNLEFDDNALIENATDIFIAHYIQEFKEKQFKKFDKPTVKNPNDPASDKQKELLKRMNYPHDVEKLSKSEAYRLISENLPKKKEDNKQIEDVEF